MPDQVTGEPMTRTNGTVKRRSLILAGGGIKVAFQAGVLQVWLDEAGLGFDHADGASGGVLNLAMICQGMSGTRIANNWRGLNPLAGISFNPTELAKLAYAESLFTLDAYRNNVFPQWGLDWSKIRASSLNATFNVFNFSRKELQVIEPRNMTEDLLVACVSLPMWFPPVHIAGQTYIDAVYLTDANLEEAIKRGADELWVIWTVSDKDEWHPGFVATYFQIIESTADGHYKAMRKRIDANNAAIAQGHAGEFGRPIEVKELKADVALHYLIDFSQDRLIETVNLGVQRAREWCKANGISLPHQGPAHASNVEPVPTKLWFTEEMKGFWSVGESDFASGSTKGQAAGIDLMFHLTITLDGVHAFVVRPEHDTRDLVGYVQSSVFGGSCQVQQGVFNLFIDDTDPSIKYMRYRLFFTDHSGRQLTLSGRKVIKDEPQSDIWRATTTLYTHILRGHISREDEEKTAKDPQALAGIIVGSGIIIIPLLDFLKQLTTFRVQAPTMPEKLTALNEFGRLFLGKLWDVYARDVLTSGPF
jgi:predicted patatin/cPLA2 family phospholipase